MAKTLAKVDFQALALGESTLAKVDATAITKEGSTISTSQTNTSAIAVGDTLALTDITSLSYAGSDDGSGAGVEASTYGTGIGTDSVSSSNAWTFAIATPSVDIAFGFATSTAAGDTYHTADASIDLIGDVGASHEVILDTPLRSEAVAVGVAVDLPDQVTTEQGSHSLFHYGFDSAYGFDFA